MSVVDTLSFQPWLREGKTQTFQEREKKMAPTQPSKFYSIERDGLTQGTLALFLECRQKAWYFLNGWSSKFPSFAITYGDIVHGILEIAYEDIRMGKLKSNPDKTRVRQYVSRIEKQ